MNYTNSHNNNADKKVKKLLNLIYEFSSECLQLFESFNFELTEYNPADRSKEITDILSHIYKGQNEIQMVYDFTTDLLSKTVKLSPNELDIVKSVIEGMIENSSSANRILTNKIDLQHLFDLKEKFS